MFTKYIHVDNIKYKTGLKILSLMHFSDVTLLFGHVRLLV